MGSLQLNFHFAKIIDIMYYSEDSEESPICWLQVVKRISKKAYIKFHDHGYKLNNHWSMI